jgi:predicted acyltransferase (DUF342 family)
MGPKYEFTGETMHYEGYILHRIKRLSDGKLGGWIEKESNLSQEGNCWVDDNAKVFDNAVVRRNAKVYGDAKVYDDALVTDNAEVYGDAQVYDYTEVYDNARVYDNVKVYHSARVYGDAQVCGDAQVYKDAEVFSIQHPMGKNASFANGKIIDIINDFEFYHNIETEQGSGGSPIILIDHINIHKIKVIGIHYGRNKKNGYGLGTFIGEIFKK